MTKAEDIEISERYDKEDDIYYVTVRTNEPSIAVECDDRLLMEIGIFTRLPTGFRIFNFSKYKRVKNGFLHAFKELCRAAGLRKAQASKNATENLSRKIGKALEAVEV